MNPVCLNVGCHDIHLGGFINIDLDPSMKPDLLWDATKLREKFADESVDFIYCGHFLEHFPVEVSQLILSDFYKLLRHYGAVSIVVPDYAKTVGLSPKEAERIILAEGTHKCLLCLSRVVEMVGQAGFTVFPTTPQQTPWCRFPEVMWQSAVLAMKHPKVVFTTG